ncbi:DNA mismatch repair endonuclease MutL [Phormidium tenue FACHB-886]|nr:DNA mismatch repair endonuclease MutL [Phormidium tenue FACHB-886]
MTAQIQVLPIDVVHLMAAGEVIDSLASVVRELAENAIDAEASRITISVWAEQWRVRVADDGMGMELADLQQAALPHSTSKIHDREDLWQVKSLGFRGEALHSLAQLSELEVFSRTAAPEGWRIRYSHRGEPIQTESAAIAPGTVVTVNHLFGNWLPRRQGLPSTAQQLRSIQLTVAHLALCHPTVTWQVEQNDRPWFAIWAGTTAKHILPQLVREIQGDDLREWRGGVGAASYSSDPVYLLLGLPDRCHRHRPDWVKVAVNGRVVKVPELEQAIFGALRRTLPRDRHPVCFVHLSLSPDQIDWNRHPTKAEIYLHQMEHWQRQVAEAIAQTLRLQPEAVPEATYTSRVGKLIKAAEVSGKYGEWASEETEEKNPLSPDALTPLKALAQVHQMYILAEHPTGMWLVEQHIAHERVLYEQLRDRWQLAAVEPPIVLHHLSEGQVEQLQRIGLTVEEFGDRLWAVRRVPEALAQREDCAAALLELSLGGDLEAALVATACRTAIRNGTSLSLEEMQTLLDQWQQTRSPRTCPHGRPIYLSLEESSLSRFFRRHWVIGKSHGI